MKPQQLKFRSGEPSQLTRPRTTPSLLHRLLLHTQFYRNLMTNRHCLNQLSIPAVWGSKLITNVPLSRQLNHRFLLLLLVALKYFGPDLPPTLVMHFCALRSERMSVLPAVISGLVVIVIFA
ncbi:unnamed protein product [Protopolystoma xenopodis]|uniref:Uncharacterized protein n=1 Tax=Protopolystoma xenopodis TaxID=117903 RepID=A0A3S5ALX2_9PLAT|nr:unnamed protein product [Protopolystoma xenopodis]